MRYALISDVHGNLEALQAVLSSIEGHRIDQTIFVGDAVGYGADPCQVLEAVKSIAVASVVGNHDYVAAGKEEATYFNPHARNAVMWTRKRLSNGEREYLAGLDVSVTLEDFTIVHATPRNPLHWDYLASIEQVVQNFCAFNTRLCFIGHSHVPAVYCMDSGGNLRVEGPGLVPLKDDYRYMINIGSVGQPRDYDPRSCYVIYDSGRRCMDFLRVPYDVSTAQEKIIKEGLPPYLAQRLALGA